MVAGPAWTASLNSAALLDSVQEAFLAVDSTGSVRGVNRSAQELFGFTAEEICGRHIDDTLRPEHGGPTGPALARLFASAPQRPVAREIRVRHRDGHAMAVRATVSVIPAADGPVACIFLTDLSGQANAEERADRNDGFLAALLDSLSVGVTACDGAGRVVVLNRAARADLGLLPEGPVPPPGAITAGAVIRDDRAVPLDWGQTPLARACRGEHVDVTDVVVEVPGRSARTFATTARPIHGPGRRRVGAVAVAQDVTAVRRLERFRTCQDTIDQILTAASSIADVTPAVLRAVVGTLGWPGAELFLLDESSGVLRPAGHWGTGDEIYGHQPVYGQAVTGRVWATGQPILVPDITARRDRCTGYERERMEACLRHGLRTALAVPVRDSGTLLGVLTCYAAAPELHEDQLVVLLNGVAAQIGACVALRRSEQLARQLSQTQEDFINLVGHELRTPLTSITANARMLAEDAALLDEEHQQMVTAIDRNAATLQSIVDALLDLAHLDSGHTDVHLGVVDLAAIVADAITVARHTAADAGVRLEACLPVRPTMAGDAARLRQVVDDVLANAITYSRPGEPVTITLDADETTIELRVTDRGIGVPPGEHGRVFDRFFRGSNVRHHGIAGHGLGLSLARAIVHLHHGTISLSDNDPTGTVVCVKLPLHEGPVSPP
jgi:PAS domain S-box-containing protein